MMHRYDPKADIMVLALGRGKRTFGEQNDNIIIHFDKEYRPIEIEILEVSKTVVKMISKIMRYQKHSKL